MTSAVKNRCTKDAGLTLTELMIAMLLFSMLAAGVMVSLVGQQKTFESQDRTNTTVDNARSTLNVMARQVRMALQGMTNGLVIVNDTTSLNWHGLNAGGVLPNCLNGAVPALHVLDGGAAGSDMLTLIYPEGRAWGNLGAPLNPTDLTVTVRTYEPPAPGTPLLLPIAAGDWVLVSNLNVALALRAGSVPLLASGDYTFSKTAASAGTTYFATPIDTGAIVFKATWLAYRINPTFFGGGDGEPVAEVVDLSATTANLVGGTLGEPAAAGIEDIQIALGIDGANSLPVDGQITQVGAGPNDDEWVYNVDGDNPPTCQDMANLLAVRITLVARSRSQTPGLKGVRPAVENRVAAVGTDGYYRVVLQQTIAVRNRGI